MRSGWLALVWLGTALSCDSGAARDAGAGQPASVPSPTGAVAELPRGQTTTESESTARASGLDAHFATALGELRSKLDLILTRLDDLERRITSRVPGNAPLPGPSPDVVRADERPDDPLPAQTQEFLRSFYRSREEAELSGSRNYLLSLSGGEAARIYGWTSEDLQRYVDSANRDCTISEDALSRLARLATWREFERWANARSHPSPHEVLRSSGAAKGPDQDALALGGRMGH